MKKNLNQVKIIGRVYSFGDANGRQALELKTTGENSKNPGTPFIGGILQIAVDEQGLNVIPVHFTYVTEVTSSGKQNATFGVLKKIIEENKTWLTVGPDNAAMVRIDASIGLNDFYNNDNQLVSSKLIEGSFVSSVTKLPAENERNTFRADMIITSATRKEEDPDNNIVEHVVLHGAVFDFRNAILPVDFIVKDVKGMEYFESQDISASAPLYTKVWGEIVCLTKVTTITEDSAFGEAAVRTYERKSREWTVTGTATLPYEFDSEETITGEELAKALQDREVHLADVKKRADDYRNSASKPVAPKAAAPKAATGEFKF